MSDPTPDPRDEVLRAALDAEADGVTAGPELLDRIQAEAARPARRPLAPWLVVAAAAVAVVGIGAVLLRDDDQEVDVSDDPTSTTASTTDTSAPLPDPATLLAIEVACEPGEVLDLTVYMNPGATNAEVAAMSQALADDPRIATARYLDAEAVRDAVAEFHDAELSGSTEDIVLPAAFVVDLAGGADETEVRADLADLPGVYGLYDVGCLSDPVDPPALGQQPALVALVREDGWLITVDLLTGQQHELYSAGDPNDSTGREESGPYWIDSVELSPDGQWIYFSTCCEPASGNTYRIPVQGGEPDLVAVGSAPRVSPDGRYLATGAGTMVIVTPVDPSSGDAATVELECCTRSLSWSPDGGALAVVHGTGAEGESPQVRLLEWDGTTLSSDGAEPANDGSFVSWTPGNNLNVSSGAPVDHDRSLSQDATYRWLLWVDEEGVVRVQAGAESGDRTIITELPEALTADW